MLKYLRKRFCVVFAVLLSAETAAAESIMDLFPYPLITVKGSEAFQEWEVLRSSSGTPIILGDREQVERILDAFDPSYDEYYDPLEISLTKSKARQHPAALYEHRVAEHRLLVESLRENGSDLAEELAEVDPLKIPEDYWGEWPDASSQPNRLISLDHRETGLPHELVYITILPTENPWEAPIYLRFGGWNANPPPDIHAAVFRDWATEFGAVPVVIQSDVVEMYIADPPTGRGSSRTLAQQQYIYSNDIVDQGVGDLSSLAALLDQGKFWYFWWD